MIIGLVIWIFIHSHCEWYHDAQVADRDFLIKMSFTDQMKENNKNFHPNTFLASFYAKAIYLNLEFLSQVQIFQFLPRL